MPQPPLQSHALLLVLLMMLGVDAADWPTWPLNAAAAAATIAAATAAAVTAATAAATPPPPPTLRLLLQGWRPHQLPPLLPSYLSHQVAPTCAKPTPPCPPKPCPVCTVEPCAPCTPEPCPAEAAVVEVPARTG